MFLRLESGLFAFIFIPLYLLHIFKILTKTEKIFYSFLLFSVYYVIYIIVIGNYERLSEAYQLNQESYIINVAGGSGVIGSLQSLPPIISDVLSVVYTAIQPIPFWAKLYTSGSYNIPECYNIMAFPTAIAGFFNFASIFYVFRGIIVKNINTNRTLKWLVFISILFLFLQSEVVSQRRVLFSYTIFYVVASLSYINTNKKTKHRLNMFILLAYFLINVLALLIIA